MSDKVSSAIVPMGSPRRVYKTELPKEVVEELGPLDWGDDLTWTRIIISDGEEPDGRIGFLIEKKRRDEYTEK